MVVTFGTDTAITTNRIRRATAGPIVRHGRQTQVWRRFDEGWRIVSAHISFIAAAAVLYGCGIPR
jgi:hypothetical protein